MEENKKQGVELCDNFYIFQCPHCQIYIEVHKNETNCKIFRCGIYKSNNQPINPHSPKTVCDELKEKDLIHGCGKPFIFKDTYVEECEYIRTNKCDTKN